MAIANNSNVSIEVLSGRNYDKLYLFGDSHYALHHPVAGVEPVHLGPVTMHRVGRDGASLILSAKDSFAENDALGFTFGEIDVRVHFSRQVHAGRDYKEVVEDVVKRYVSTISEVLKVTRANHAVIFSIVPPSGLAYANFDPSYPRTGTDQERAIWTKYFNTCLLQAAKRNDYGFVDQYSQFIGPDGLLAPAYTEDGVHISQAHFRLVDWSKSFRSRVEPPKVPSELGQAFAASTIVSHGGFIVGWEKALSGNGLSCLANMFLLSRRFDIPAVYTYPRAFGDVFERADIHIVDPKGYFDTSELIRFLAANANLFETEPVLCQGLYTPTDFAGLAESNDADVISFSEHHIGLVDWRQGGADSIVSSYCKRGNGLVITGCYWRQYLDMRELADDGAALRKHLGPLRPEKNIVRRNRMISDVREGRIRIGVHFRLADDYKVWMGGIFHLPIESTLSAMKRIHEELRLSPHIFYLFSDIEIDIAEFAGLPIFYERENYADDFIAISSCDYIVGAPSTFASWAAFLGGAKRVVLTREQINAYHIPLIETAVNVPFPNGHYLPGDATGRTI